MEPISFKVLVIGDAAVGKSSIVRRLISNDFSEKTESTVGVDFVCYSTEIDNHEVKLQIWDTAGQEQYRSISKIYYRNAVGVLLVCSFTDHISLENIERWLKDARNLCHPSAKMILVANKSDLLEDRCVTTAEISSLAQSFGIEWVEASAKSGDNISDLFYTLAREVYSASLKGEIVVDDVLASEMKEKTKKKGCC